MGSCPACGAEVELGRLTGILGIVCRGCDAYNEPGAKTCAGCGMALGKDGSDEATALATRAAPPAPPAPPASVAPPAAAAGPVVRSFGKGGGQATRFIPAAALRAPVAGPGTMALPAATACPRCGTPAAIGSFCAHCGQQLGERGTQAVPRPPGAGSASEVLAPVAGKGRARLIVVNGDGREGATFRLDADVVEAGRARGTVVFPDDPFLAPHHATFFYRGSALHVRDEGAPGGTFLRLRGLSVPLRPGDAFALGDRLLRFVGPLAPPPPPAVDGTRRLGAPRPAGQAVVLEESLEGGGTGRVFVRSGPSLTLGRAGCAVNLGDEGTLSQAHAELFVEADGSARLRDLGSSTGTFVRLPPHAERELRDGDAVRIGREVLRVAAEG
jgi:pSer/pThr/pTyr-binding forkhead associated (FHA) protein